MRKILALLMFAGCSVACSVSSSDDNAPQSGAVRGAPGTPPDEQPNDPPTDEPGDDEPGEGPSGEEPNGGPTCKDPKPVTPEGWTSFDQPTYSVALQPGAAEIVDGPPSDSHRWWVVAPDGEILGEDGNVKTGFVHARASFLDFTTLDQIEEHLRTKFFLGEDGKTLLSFSRGSRDCREELVATWIRPTNHLEWHFVVIDGKVHGFGCDLRPIYVDVCRKFVASFDPK